MSETDPYAPPAPDDDSKVSDEIETKPIAYVDQPFAAYGGTAGFIINVMF